MVRLVLELVVWTKVADRIRSCSSLLRNELAYYA